MYEFTLNAAETLTIISNKRNSVNVGIFGLKMANVAKKRALTIAEIYIVQLGQSYTLK